MERKFKIATGKSRFDRRWQNVEVTWEWLCARLKDAQQTHETASEYRAFGRDMQTQIKDVGGFVGGYLRDGVRKVGNVGVRSLVTLDYDDFSAARLSEVRGALAGRRWALHSTHKHSEQAWRVRLVIPLSRDVSPDEYGAVARKLAQRCGFGGIDRTTFEACRLMFWPSYSKDAPYLFETGDGDWADADAILAEYADWSDMSTWPLLPEEELAGLFAPERPAVTNAGVPPMAAADALKGLGRHGKQEDPMAKKGLIGAFCRTFDIDGAIMRFLPEVYTRSGRNRYTHTGSSTSGGAWVLDGGRFLYSFHSTDKVNGRLVNSWDLVRIHLFLDRDAGVKEDRNPDRMPSFKAMEDFAMADPDVRVRLIEERTGAALDDFDGMDLTDEERDEMKEWRRTVGEHLKPAKDGTVRTSASNVKFVLQGDPALKGRIRLDEFSGKLNIFGSLPWKKGDRTWDNFDSADLRVYLDERYGMAGKEKIDDALKSVSRANGYHPVKQYLDSLKWDGEKRLGRLFIDVLGAEDTPLNRKLPELFFMAAVRRIRKPGVKFDYFIIVYGPEGCGKSSLFSLMGGEWFSDSLDTIEGKEAKESIQGKWVIEMPELSSLRRSDMDKLKQFISSQVDSYRPAYGTVTEDRPRQCVMIGTTNDEFFLRGIMADNRRHPVVEIDPGLRSVTESVREWVATHRDQLWAEACVLEESGEQLWLDDSYKAQMREVQNRHNLDRSNVLFPEVERFLDFYLPPMWDTWGITQRIEWIDSHPYADKPDILGGNELRSTVTVAEILQECLRMRKTDKDYLQRSRDIGQFLRSLEKLWVFIGVRKSQIYGGQKTWKRRMEISGRTRATELTTEPKSVANKQPNIKFDDLFGCQKEEDLNSL